ncbi:hypothetical protein ACEPAI_4493 [Sanghuangporus weigelae]
MTSMLSLPFELKLKIAQSLLSLAMDQTYDDPRTVAEDVECAIGALKDIQNLSMTCRGYGALSSEISDGVRLVGGEAHTSFLRKMGEGTVPQATVYGRKTKFLSLERPSICDTCGFNSDIVPHDHQVVVAKLFSHFPSITTLNLSNFRITYDTIHALIPLKALRTLSIRQPEPGWTQRNGVLMKRRSWSLPQVISLSILTNDFGACNSVRDVMWFFEPKLITVSIKSEKHLCTKMVDFLGACDGIYAPFGPPCFQNLKHLLIGYLEFKSSSLREFIRRCGHLELLSVDCRGVPGLIPLFYIIDLLREQVGDVEGQQNLTDYDALRNNRFEDPEAPPQEPYVGDAEIWRRSVASFACTFGMTGSTPDGTKWIKSLELEFASVDAESKPLNEDMCFDELSKVFYRDPPTFSHMDTLSIAMSKEREFESSEDVDEIEETISEISHRSIRWLKNFNLDWGKVSFCVSE